MRGGLEGHPCSSSLCCQPVPHLIVRTRQKLLSLHASVYHSIWHTLVPAEPHSESRPDSLPFESKQHWRSEVCHYSQVVPALCVSCSAQHAEFWRMRMTHLSEGVQNLITRIQSKGLLPQQTLLQGQIGWCFAWIGGQSSEQNSLPMTKMKPLKIGERIRG